MFSSGSFMVSSFTFRSLIHYKFIFVYGVRECSNFILLHIAVQFSQHHLLKRLSFLHCRFLLPLLYVWVFKCVICAIKLSSSLASLIYISLNTYMLDIFCCPFECTVYLSLPCCVLWEADLGVRVPWLLAFGRAGSTDGSVAGWGPGRRWEGRRIQLRYCFSWSSLWGCWGMAASLDPRSEFW